MSNVAKLSIEGREFDIPVIEGTEKEKGLDISKLRAQTGLITVDEGFGNTGSCESEITFINGEEGILRHRGYRIEDLAGQSSFIEVAHLLIWGELPTRSQLEELSLRLTNNALLHESLKHHFEGFPSTSNPMAMLSAMINALSCYHPDLLSFETEEQINTAAILLMSKIRTIAAFSYKMSRGEPFVYPDPSRKYVDNLLYMMFTTPHAEYDVPQEISEAMDLIMMLHADHEQNCSTSTVRMVGSSRANLFASVSAGVCALWGPLHGGANMAVIDMLEKIHKGGMDADECIRLAKDKDSSFRLMGFGHRVYKNYDPRARLLCKAADRVLTKLKKADPLLDIARSLEEKALKDPFFVERKLYPNVDFYSGMLMRAIGIPTNMFTVMFSIGRLPGWMAHWREQHLKGRGRICRPRQIYIGPTERKLVALDKR